MLHRGSTEMAHHLDRFAFRDPEPLRMLAAILNIDFQMVEEYVDLFGDQPTLLERRALVSINPRSYRVERMTVPAYEAHLRAHVEVHTIRILH